MVKAWWWLRAKTCSLDVSYFDNKCVRLLNDPSTEEDKKNHSGCSIFSFTRNYDKQWTTCLLDVKHICELKETTSSTFFNMASKNLVLTMTYLTTMHGPQFMTYWISWACCADCCQQNYMWSDKLYLLDTLRPHISIHYFNGSIK
jgi:hypothetical protein